MGGEMCVPARADAPRMCAPGQGMLSDDISLRLKEDFGGDPLGSFAAQHFAAERLARSTGGYKTTGFRPVFEADSAHDVAHEAGVFSPSSALSLRYELRERSHQDPFDVRLAVQKSSGSIRRFLSIPRPRGAEPQERLRAMVRTLRSLRSDNVTRVLDVFEDARALSLVTENCTGGTVYDRILSRNTFSEQETAVLIRHMLEAVLALHEVGLSHGHLSPSSFQFQTEEPHAPLKLADFGLEMQTRYDSTVVIGGRITDGGEQCGSTNALAPSLQFLEATQLVFYAPEILRPLRPLTFRNPLGSFCKGSPQPIAWLDHDASSSDDFDKGLLGEVIQAHLDSVERTEELSYATADVWGIGTSAFLLLCGYPPFFAPCRYAVAERADKADYSFDPPFWSKISEEAKDFVQRCMCADASMRMSVHEALRHPWIESLADTSPCSSMLSTFALNLRRFYRTSMIERFAANSIAAQLTFSQLKDLFLACSESDLTRQTFFTSKSLQQVLAKVGCTEISEAVSMNSARMSRHPGEAYLDYTALVDSARARRERLLEEELWAAFCAFAGSDGSPTLSAPERSSCAESGKSESFGGLLGAKRAMVNGRLTVDRSGDFLMSPLAQRVVEEDGLDLHIAATAIRQTAGGDSPFIEFADLFEEVLRLLPAPVPAPAQAQARPSPKASAASTSMRAPPPQPKAH